MRVLGKHNNLIAVGGQAISPPCDYADDVAFIFGYQRIYLRRHIFRAFDEAKANLEPAIAKFNAETIASFLAKAKSN